MSGSFHPYLDSEDKEKADVSYTKYYLCLQFSGTLEIVPGQHDYKHTFTDKGKFSWALSSSFLPCC
jgi:hypothetical protein